MLKIKVGNPFSKWGPWPQRGAERKIKFTSKEQACSGWGLWKYQQHLRTWVDAFLPWEGKHSTALRLRFFTWLPSWHVVGFQSDGSGIRPTCLRLFFFVVVGVFFKLLTEAAVYTCCISSLEMPRFDRVAFRAWRSEVLSSTWGF